MHCVYTDIARKCHGSARRGQGQSSCAHQSAALTANFIAEVGPPTAPTKSALRIDASARNTWGAGALKLCGSPCDVCGGGAMHSALGTRPRVCVRVFAEYGIDMYTVCRSKAARCAVELMANLR